MSPRFAGVGAAADHDRARALAATRLGEVLPAGDVAWLEDHLAACSECAAAAAEYDEQRRSLRTFRLDFPDPPRDLWARTAAAIETEGAARSWRSGWRLRALPLAPVAGLMVVAVAVGLGLLDGRSLLPGETRTGDRPMPTPINVDAAEVEVLSRAADGTVQILTRRVTQVCPMGADACGLAPSDDVTSTATSLGFADLDAIISPTRDRMVVVNRSEGAGRVYVVTMALPTPSPTLSALPTWSASPTPSASPTLGDASPTPAPTVTVAPTEAPATPVPVTPDPSPAAAPEPTPETTPSQTEGPTSSIPVSPAPDGALEIARDVIVLGGMAAYSADGTRFAFTARPADGSAGPDVYVWTVGDTEAQVVTTSQAAVFSGWLDERLIISRLVDGRPETVLLDLVDRTEEAVSVSGTWRPAVGPSGRVAAWWDGEVTLGDGGVVPVPGVGRLVLASWTEHSPDPQVLAEGPLTDWRVHWDTLGTAIAVWTSTGNPGEAGLLSLYAVDSDTGRADTDHPLIAAAPAFDGFSLKPGRLVWSAPAEGEDTTVQVVAWSGRDLGRLELSKERGVTVVR